MSRRAIPKRVRFEVLKRDAWTCVYCGRSRAAHGVILEIDHVVPVALGGDDDPSNLCTSCEDCNLGKGAVPLDDSQIARILEPKTLGIGLLVLVLALTAFVSTDGFVRVAATLLMIFTGWRAMRRGGGLASW